MSNTLPLKKLRVGVLRGGPSSEYEVSLKTGNNVLSTLRDSGKYVVRDIFIDKNGVWHVDGVPRGFDRIFPHIDVAFNALHGQYGEDGRVQQLLEAHNIPYTGSKSLPSALGMNKVLSKKYFRNSGLLTPAHIVIKDHDYNEELLYRMSRDFPHMVLVKPASSGSSLGVSVAKDSESLQKAVEDAFKYSDTVIIEEFLNGREATCGVVESTQGNHVYALSPIEIRNLSSDKEVWGYDSKYSDDLHDLICPGNFTKEETEEIQRMSIEAHKALGLSHYSRSDFIVTPQGIYILEVNTLPGLTSASLFPKALNVAELSLADFFDHIIHLAVNKR